MKTFSRKEGGGMARDRSLDIAVTGLFGRFPGCSNLNEWWTAIEAGEALTIRYERRALIDAGVAETTISDPRYVPVRGHLEDADRFDNQFFRIAPRDAELMDPQHRLMLEAAWCALEDSGSCISDVKPVTGVYASGSGSGYLRAMLSGQILDEATLDQALHGTQPDFVASLISYKLDLTGPAVGVQTACSSSLVGIHLAMQGLLNGDCDQALVVAAGVAFPQAGHLHMEGGILSASGQCRPFDERADGIVEGSGVACVALRRLEDALRDGQEPYGVILGAAVNNDGAAKTGYYAPSAAGQEAVIRAALEMADAAASSIGYLEAHGTGTRVGDPIEWSAASAAYRAKGAAPGQIAVGALKANIGHLDAAAGLASLIKTLFVLKRGVVPPIAGFNHLNTLLDSEGSPLFVPRHASPWPGPRPRRAGISSFGIGGTNAHLIVEEPPPEPRRPIVKPRQCIVALSAADPDALARSAARLRDHLAEACPEIHDVAFTLARRAALPRRMAVVGSSIDAIGQALASHNGIATETDTAPNDRPPPCVFLFPGNGAQSPGMAAPLAAALPKFQAALDACLDCFESQLRDRLRAALFDRAFPEKDLESTALAQPALFAIEYAAASALIALGAIPAGVAGHSLGEIAAATVAGIFDLPEAARLVAARGRAMQQCAPGAMLALGCDETQALDLARASGLRICVSAINTPNDCVVSGAPEAIEAFQASLPGSVYSRRIRADRAFHSELIEPALRLLTAELAPLSLKSPTIPIALSATGHVVNPGEVAEKRLFIEQARLPVRFSDALASLATRFPGAIAVEVGPGRALSAMANVADFDAMPLAPTGSPRDERAALRALGALWCKGQPIRLNALCENGRPTRLPTYPFAGPRWLAPEIANARSSLPRTGLYDAPLEPGHHAVVTRGLSLWNKDSDEPAASSHNARESLAAIWEETLGHSDLNDESDFFALGGDSLLIATLGRRIQRRLGVSVPLRSLLSVRTLGGQTSIVAEVLAKEATHSETLTL